MEERTTLPLNPLQQILKDLEPLFESRKRESKPQHSRWVRLLMRFSLYSFLVGTTLALANGFWHLGWADYVIRATIAICSLSGIILMTSGAVGGIRSIKNLSRMILQELSESSELEYQLINRLRERDEFLLSCAEEKLKKTAKDIEGRSSVLSSFLDKYKAILPLLALALASASTLQKLVNVAFGFDLAQVVAMMLLGFFVAQIFSRGTVDTLSRAIFVLQQAREAKRLAHASSPSITELNSPAKLTGNEQTIKLISASSN
jgi:hypothetical protein